MNKKEEKNKEMESLFIDTLTELPLQFKCGGKYYNIYQKSMGMTFLLGRYKSLLNFDEENIKASPVLEAQRICEQQPDIVLRMIALATKRGRKLAYDEEDTLYRIENFKKNMSTADMTSLLLYILQDDNITLKKLTKHFKIDREQERKRAIARVKDSAGSRNSLTIGGTSTFGTILDFCMERYGWTAEHTIWGESYLNLMMLYYDHPDSIYLTDEEIKKLPAKYKNGIGDYIDPTTPEGIERIKNMNWD